MFCSKVGLLHSMSRSQRRFKMLVNVCPDDIFWTTEHFVAKPGMVLQHHKPESSAENLVHFVHCQGHSKGLYNPSIPRREARDVCLPPVWNSGLSFDSTFLSPLLFFCLVVLPFCLIFFCLLAFLLDFFQKILQYFSLRDRLFCMAPV